MLNFRHLYYFWVVNKEGGFARAAERLDMAVQTISAQVKELEKSVGHQLLKPAGRGVTLTDAGHAAYARAEEIFQLGQLIPDEVHAAANGNVVRLAVGLADGISKLAVHALLKPVLATPHLRLLCHEGEVDQLLGELALHQLDLVLAGQAAPPNANLRLTSERLIESPVDWYAPVQLLESVDAASFPDCLNRLPVLLPTTHSALRPALDRWCDAHGLRPHIAGEFEDSALLSVFAAHGLGVFPISRLGAADLVHLPQLRLLGSCNQLMEEIHAIRSRRGLHHPLTMQVIAAAHALQRDATASTTAAAP